MSLCISDPFFLQVFFWMKILVLLPDANKVLEVRMAKEIVKLCWNSYIFGIIFIKEDHTKLLEEN